MTPFASKNKGSLTQYNRLVLGNRIKTFSNGKEFSVYHWTHRFKHIDFEKSLGRAFEDYQKESEQAEKSTKTEICELQKIFPKKLKLIPAVGAKDMPAQIIGLYFLFKDNQIVYVGKSDACIRARVLAHQRRKIQFNKIAIAEIPTMYETAFIGALNPKHNFQHLTSFCQRKHLHIHIINLLNNSLEQPLANDLGVNYIKMYCWGNKYIYCPIT